MSINEAAQTANVTYLMTLMLIFSIIDSFLASPSSSFVIQAPCSRLFMRNLDNETNIPWVALSGIYKLMANVTLNTYPVYRHEKYPNVRFFYNDSLKQLWISEDKVMFAGATTSGWFSTTSLSSRPNPFESIIKNWYFWDAVSQKFRLAGKTAIEPWCVDNQFAYCDSGELVTNDVIRPIAQYNKSVVSQSFRQVRGLYNDLRPVYITITSNPRIYLYHNDNRWMLGLNYMQSSAFAVVTDSAMKPELITRDWYFFDATANRLNLNATFKVNCKGKKDNYYQIEIMAC